VALLAEFVTQDIPFPESSVVKAVGYGAGDNNPPETPNVLRITLLESSEGLPSDTVDILETNVDDITGEVLSAVLTRLMAAGARDVSAIPCLMKKGRAGYLIRVIALPGDTDALAQVMASELGTLGIRCQSSVHRFIADRKILPVPVEINGITRDIPVKCGFIDGRCFTIKVEFDAAREFANKLGIPVREVILNADEQARARFRPHTNAGAPR
jgi:uncharacterized protein (DUF111 family)